MTKEEKEAINNIKVFIRSIRSDLTEESEDNQKLANDIETLLSMLKEKDAEIEKKDKIIDLMSEDWYKEEGYKNRLYEGESEITRYEIKKEILVEQYKKHYERKVENE